MMVRLIELPRNSLYLARRTLSLSAMAAGEVAAAVFPSLLMPRDRVAWEAWVLGYLYGEPPQNRQTAA